MLRYDFAVDSVEGARYVARTVGYRYQVLDPQGQELLAYHWHPTGVSPVTYPHLHLSSRVRPIEVGQDADPVALGEMHLPTGFVAFADVVRLLIAEFGAQPRQTDWAAIVDRDLPTP